MTIKEYNEEEAPDKDVNTRPLPASGMPGTGCPGAAADEAAAGELAELGVGHGARQGVDAGVTDQRQVSHHHSRGQEGGVEYEGLGGSRR